jgi:hypothetical protein
MSARREWTRERLLEDVQARRLDPLTAVREILDKVFRIDSGDGTHAR